MMEPITIGRFQQRTSPNPFALLSTRDTNGKNNLMAISWWTYVSSHPATIAVCLSQHGYSGSVITSTGEFCLCLPDESICEAAFRCGTCSGRDHDKPSEFGIALEPAEHIKAMRVTHSAMVLECRLQKAVDIGDHTAYFAEVLGCYESPQVQPLYAFDGYRRLALATEQR